MVKDFYAVVAPVIAFIIFAIVCGPRYNVYKQTMWGKAELARAEKSRMSKEEADTLNLTAMSNAKAYSETKGTLSGKEEG